LTKERRLRPRCVVAENQEPRLFAGRGAARADEWLDGASVCRSSKCPTSEGGSPGSPIRQMIAGTCRHPRCHLVADLLDQSRAHFRGVIIAWIAESRTI